MNKKYVLVEAVQQRRVSYVVELKSDDPAEWAVDDVVSAETIPFSKEDLGEIIVSHRVLSGGLPEALELARQDNSIGLLGKTDEEVFKAHITPLKPDAT